MTRCINIDWLEVYCLESYAAPRDAAYFNSLGYKVEERAYGTPNYREMFTVYQDGEKFVEVRRSPYSTKDDGGIFERRACHLRLTNQACYLPDAIEQLRLFLVAHDYTYKAVSRIDICYDFNIFDNKMNPQEFVKQYMRGRLSKVNQAALSAHGTDRWDGRLWNSIKWGSPSSPITTKLYNKSLELTQCGDKPYIRDAWRAAGLDCDTQAVWRIEFSLTAQMQSLRAKKTGEYKKKNLSDYDTAQKLWYNFIICYNKYFDFRRIEYTRTKDGVRTLKRKYDCQRLLLIVGTLNDQLYEPCRNRTEKAQPNRTLKIIANALYKIAQSDDVSKLVADAATNLYAYFSRQYHTQELLILRKELQGHPLPHALEIAAQRARNRAERRQLKKLLTTYGYQVIEDDYKRTRILWLNATFGGDSQLPPPHVWQNGDPF